MSTIISGDYSPPPQCLVTAGAQGRILLPPDPGYKERLRSYWCNSAKLHLGCIVQLESASEVAAVVKARADAGQVIADTMYDAVVDMAHMGPGAKWKSVYAELEKHGRVVAGGREAEVGVGGFLLGGGNTFQNPANATVNFTTGASENHESTLNFTVCHIPRFGGAAVVAICVNLAGVENPPAFAELAEMPKLMNNLKTTTLAEALAYATLPTDILLYTLCFKNDVSILAKVTELYRVMAKKAEEKVTDGDFTAHCSLQPIPRVYTEHSVAAGGNMFGLENYPHDAILIQANIMVREMIQGVRDFAATVPDGLCPWLYLNYAHPEQAVLQSYGRDNLDEMRKASSKFDPNAVFQKLCPGGYKLRNTES
ncbi:hypothetical protein F4678DRAFT_472949 [Xylaria arbuscula]|nr:hypothetical protein F4678DRAFT_472949 [Xylaria arbuscula]